MKTEKKETLFDEAFVILSKLTKKQRQSPVGYSRKLCKKEKILFMDKKLW